MAEEERPDDPMGVASTPWTPPSSPAPGPLLWGREGRAGGTGVILLLCGSFNPVTRAHLALVAHGAAALPGGGDADLPCAGAVLSPVHDAYGKPGLAPGTERVAMCRLAADACGGAMPVGGGAAVPVVVDAWEATQDGYSTTLDVLRRVRDATNGALERERTGRVRRGLDGRAGLFDHYRVMLLCGEDLLASFLAPGVWVEAHVREILSDEFGLVCVARADEGAEGSSLGRLEQMVLDNELLLGARNNLRCVPGGGPSLDGVSSTRVRRILRQVAPAAPLPETLLELVEPAVARHALSLGLYAAD